MFAERFNDLLKQKGITAYRVAKDCDISQGTMNMYKNGKRIPGKKSLLKMADYLGVSVDYLLGREDSEPTADPAINRLRNLLDQIPPDRYDDAETILRLIIEARKKR